VSSLKTVEKTAFEDLFEMGGGYVLDFSNNTFATFFRENANIDIYDDKYAINGRSKARRLRAFWKIESDLLVGRLLSELLEYWHFKNPTPDEQAKALADRCTRTVERLIGHQIDPGRSEREFLGRDLKSVSLAAVPIDEPMVNLLEARYAEAERCLQHRAPLATIFMAGSILEGLLLGVACARPQQFNQAPNSPKDSKAGSVKPFQNWRLAELIDVACELKYLHLDVKKFSHALRDFRNYIHPYQQKASGFAPDEHTARICLQVLRAAIASLSNQREG